MWVNGSGTQISMTMFLGVLEDCIKLESSLKDASKRYLSHKMILILDWTKQMKV